MIDSKKIIFVGLKKYIKLIGSKYKIEAPRGPRGKDFFKLNIVKFEYEDTEYLILIIKI